VARPRCSADLTAAINHRAEYDDLGNESESPCTGRQTGRLLKSLRLEPDRTAIARGWQIGREALIAMAQSYGIKRENIIPPSLTS